MVKGQSVSVQVSVRAQVDLMHYYTEFVFCLIIPSCLLGLGFYPGVVEQSV